jgi:hypothetical protein
VPRLFAEIGGDDMVDGVLDAVDEHDADLVVYESYALAAPLAAEVAGVPATHHLISPIIDPEVLGLASDAIAPLWRSKGRAGSPPYAGLYDGTTIEIMPPSLEARSVPGGETLRMRPCPLPAAVAASGGRPLVYLTLGTALNSATDVFRSVLAALGNDDVDVVVTVGADRDPADLGAVPANVLVERYIPQETLLPHCAAVVHHGGSGTMLGALAHGLPQLVIPQGADNFVNGALLDACGAGASLDPSRVEAEVVCRAVRTLLEDPGPRRAAERCAPEIEGMPGPVEVARDLRARYDAEGAGGDAT